MKLLAYKYVALVPFGHGEYKTVYQLTILKRYFFGLYKRSVQMQYEVSMFGNIADYEKHWDELIATGQSLK